MEKTVQLTSSIKNGTDEISEITLREPTGADVAKLGVPFVFHGEDLKLDMSVVSSYISRLGAVPPSVVNKLSPKDLMIFAGIVGGFFGDMD